MKGVVLAGGLEVTDVCKDIFEVFDSFQRRRPDVAILDMPVLPAPEILADVPIFAIRFATMGSRPTIGRTRQISPARTASSVPG